MNDDYADQHVFVNNESPNHDSLEGPCSREMSPYSLKVRQIDCLELRIRELEEQNTLLRSEMNKLEDENSTLKRRMSLMNEHSKLFEQCEVMRKAIDANIHRMHEIEKMVVDLERR